MWVSITPLGFPVDPLVYIIIATSSPFATVSGKQLKILCSGMVWKMLLHYLWYLKFVYKFGDDCLPCLSPESICPVVSILESGRIDGIELADSCSSKTEFFFNGCSKYTTNLISFGNEESMLCNFGTKCWLVKITFGDVCWIPYLEHY